MCQTKLRELETGQSNISLSFSFMPGQWNQKQNIKFQTLLSNFDSYFQCPDFMKSLNKPVKYFDRLKCLKFPFLDSLWCVS